MLGLGRGLAADAGERRAGQVRQRIVAEVAVDDAGVGAVGQGGDGLADQRLETEASPVAALSRTRMVFMVAAFLRDSI